MEKVVVTYKGENKIDISGTIAIASSSDMKLWFGFEPKIGDKFNGFFNGKHLESEKSYWNKRTRSLSGINFDCRTGIG